MWNDVGVKTNFKEVTPDEYRGSQSSNALDVHAWDKGQPLAIIAGNPETFKAPFGTTSIILKVCYGLLTLIAMAQTV